MTGLNYQIFNLCTKSQAKTEVIFLAEIFPLSQFVPIIALVIVTFAIVEAVAACGGSEAYEHVPGADAKVMQK